MTEPVATHVGPWTEEDLGGLPDDVQRCETLTVDQPFPLTIDPADLNP